MKKKQESALRQIEKDNCQARLPESAKWFIVLACILFDCICFYTTYSLLLQQNDKLNILTVLVTALTMDLFPVILGMLLSRDEKNRMEVGMIISIAIAFICEAVMSFFLRYNTRSMLFGEGSSDFGGTYSQEAAQMFSETMTEAVSSASQSAQTGVVILLGILPILTSLLSFAVGYENPKRKKKEQKAQHILTLKEEINHHITNIELLENEMERRDLYKLDKVRFAIADLLIDLTEVGMQVKVGQEMAAVLKDVDATTILTEDSELQEKINHLRRRLQQTMEETDFNEEEFVDEKNV